MSCQVFPFCFQEHYEMCDHFPIKCTEGCGEEIPRGSVSGDVVGDNIVHHLELLTANLSVYNS